MSTPGPIDVSDLPTTTNLTATDIILAVAALVAGWILGRLAHSAVLKLLHRMQGISEDLRRLAARAVKYFVWLMAVGLALTFLGAELQPLLTAGIVIAVIAALALRGVAENFAAGVVIQTNRPVQIGDEIESLDYVGTVTALNGRSVVVQTFDGRLVHLPNKEVLENPLLNNSAHVSRRTSIEVRASRPEDVEAMLQMIRDVVGETDGVLADPPPVVALMSADPVRIVILVHVWHGSTNGAPTWTAVIRRLADEFHERGVDATVVTPPPPQPLTPPPAL